MLNAFLGALKKQGWRTLRLTTLLLCAYAVWRIINRLRRKRSGPMDPRVTLSLTGSGSRIAYHLGVIACLRDHVDLSNVRMSSISGGACMLIVLALQHVEISEMMLLGLRMMERMIKNNGTGTYFLKQEEVMDQILRDLRVMCHMEDEDIARLSREHRAYVGVTTLTPYPQHANICIPRDPREALLTMGASMTIPPFFRSFGRVNGKVAIDGCFTRLYSLPDDHNPARVIRICPFPWPFSDIRPPLRDLPRTVFEGFVPLRLDWQIRIFSQGYEDAERTLPMLLGAPWSLRPIPDARNRLKEHIARFNKLKKRLEHYDDDDHGLKSSSSCIKLRRGSAREHIRYHTWAEIPFANGG
ncbi:hypothetical protein FOZ62_000269 [Perkinsus olseni]|uniref:PNPLA domain-containing protein n=2 Tax=Perkinsus olseni TaxID=32597 RepID=A0A7J6T3A9_PEROL|nr:hypothetical protein FOZ62_000269 [Perkinsus olseni]